MRRFYLNLLQNLDKLTGHRQYEKLRELPNYKDEINGLLDVLCRVSEIFKYIPEEAQKNIVSDSIITDPEFIGLNARILYKWFNLRKDIYFKEAAHIEKESEPPVTGEKREEWLKIWEQQLGKMEDAFAVKPLSNAELMREKLHGKDAKPTNYKPIDEEAVEKKRLHTEYIKANYDPLTGNALETWMPEDQWLRNNTGLPVSESNTERKDNGV